MLPGDLEFGFSRTLLLPVVLKVHCGISWQSACTRKQRQVNHVGHFRIILRIVVFHPRMIWKKKLHSPEEAFASLSRRQPNIFACALH